MSFVTKRSGKKEALDMDKIHAVVQRACEGLDVSASEIELRSKVQFAPGIKTAAIHDLIVRAAADLISEDATDYQYAAGRLLAFGIHKQVFGTSAENPPKLSEWILSRIDDNIYDSAFATKVTPAEWSIIDAAVDHSKDSDYTYAGMMQFFTKYLLRNRVTGELYETPQFALMAICVAAFMNESNNKLDLDAVLYLYEALCEGRVSLPTPIMAGLRSPQKQFSSCVLIEAADSLDSINASAAAIVKYVSQKAGIGIGAGVIRPQGAPVRGGDTAHTGAIGFFKHFYSAIGSCSQGGVRKGSGTLAYPIWHLDVEDFLVLKNNKGTEETRIRQLDYSVQFSKLFYERLIQGGNITLMAPNAVPGLYDAFFADQQKFRSLYEAAEKDSAVRKKVVSAIELFSAFMMERKDTGRIYLQNVDHANDHGSFDPSVAPIRMSNLCVAGDTMVTIKLPTGQIEDIRVDELARYVYFDNIDIKAYSAFADKVDFYPLSAWAKTSPSKKVLRVRDGATGFSIVCTPDHKLYTTNRGWVEAKDLLSDDRLLTDLRAHTRAQTAL